MRKFYVPLFACLLPLLGSAQITWNFATTASPTSGTPVANISTISDVSQGNNNGTTPLISTTSASSGYTGASGTGNAGAAARTGALVTGAGGSAYFEFTLTPAAGFAISISAINFGSRSTGTGPADYDIRTSLDNFASAAATATTTANSTWALRSNTVSITGAASAPVTVRIYGWGGAGSPAAGTANWRIDDLAVTASATSGAPVPTIIVSPASLSGFTATTGTPSAVQSFTVSGTNLVDSFSITVPAPYEASLGTDFAPTAIGIQASGGTIPNTTINVRIMASAPVGAANATATVSSAGASTQNVTLSGTVNSNITVNPPQSFSAAIISTTEIDLSATADAANDNVVIAYNTSATFGTPSGALSVGNSISGGGTVLYSGALSGAPIPHTGLNPATTYFYSIWSVGASNTYSTSLTANATTSAPPAAKIVINQVYGGGGNSGATYKNDFVELYNDENFAVNLAGWSLQYGSAQGTSYTSSPLTGTIQPHSFFLVQEGAGTGGTVNLPTPDATGTLNIGSITGKVILCNVTAAQSGTPPLSGSPIIDKVGWGSPNDFEGSGPADSTSNTTSVARVADGVDNNDNAHDFMIIAPLPRNSSYTHTAPVVSSLTPANGAIGMPSTLVPTIVFDKPVAIGSGSITIYVNGNPGSPITVGAGTVTINSNTVTINTTLAPGTSYAITVTPGSFQDVYGNAFAGITNTTTWAFTTYNSAVATTLPASFDFQACTGSGLLPNGFTQYSTTGAQIWDCTAFGRDPNAPTGTAAFPNGVQINGFANGVNNLNMDWLISPKLDLTGTTFPLLSFWSRNAFDGAPLQLKISTDYTGSGDPALATWTDLNGKFPSSGSDTWTLSGNINLSSYKQNSVYIAFVYTSTTDDGSRWTLDDISLVNSSTPPPPSLTLSAATLEFGYTATGGNSTQTLVVTGNDLVGDVTLTTTGNFQISTDGGTTFGSTATITQATANNVPQSVLVRFAPATNNIQYSETLTATISDSTGTVILKGNSIDPASTLNVVDWNLNWFATPDPTLGPTDKSLQETNVAIVLKSLPADLFALQEVVNQHALDSIVATMPGYAYVVGQYGSFSNPNEPTADPLTEVQKLAFVYNTAKISNIQTDSLLTLGVTNPADLSNPYYNDFASGRFPYMMTADVKLSDNNGGFITQKIRFINIHAKANTAPVLTAYQRRLAGARALDSLIKVNYINDNVVILGDFNDDLNQTITAGVTPPVSSYSPFTVNDASLYIFPTMPLSPAGQHSDVSFTSVIDNVMATNAMAKYYLPSSATVLSNVANLVSKYGTTTTDHYPVFTQYSFSTAAALPVNLLSFTAVKQNAQVKVSWSTAQEENSQSFDVERSADGNNSSFTKIGTVAAQGFSSVKTDYSFTDKLPLAGVNYYRLKQVDRDSRFVYSPVVKLNFAASFSISITPNPASTFVNISLNNATEAITVQFIDLNGRLVKQQVITPGTQGLPLQVGGLAKGLYTVKAISSSAVSTQKVLIQ